MDWGIPWGIVAMRMGHNRSEKQCRDKWNMELRLEYEFGSKRTKWCSYDSFMLIKKLDSSYASDEQEVAWDELCDDEWGHWTSVYLRDRWGRLRRTVTDYQKKSFDEIVIELVERFGESPPVKPRQPKTPATIDFDDEIGNVEIANEEGGKY